MKKSKALRLAGFAGALCASGALLGTSISGTGAYFTDSHSGQINTSTGTVRVTTDPGDNGQLNFTNLLPGEYQDQPITYTAAGTGAEDIWLVFPTTSTGGSNPSEAFTGNPNDAVGGGLGRYGHFAVSSTNGAHFTSYNLNNPSTSPGDPGPSCTTDPNGWGGSNQQATDKTDHSVPWCAPANAILLASNLTNGQGGTATLTFGFTPLLRSGQGASLSKLVSYQIVATQHGVTPNDPNN
jgi:hypothetical protein